MLPKCPSAEEWIKKMWYILQWNEIVPFEETQMDLEAAKQSEVSQKKKNKYHININNNIILMHIYGN